MDRTGIGFIIFAGLLVFGLFAYGNMDQIGIAAATTETEIRLDRQPDLVQATAEAGMTITSRVIAGVIVSLILAVAIFAYQQARIRELKEGGWERFWSRRRVEGGGMKARKPSLETLVTMMLMRDMKRDDRNR